LFTGLVEAVGKVVGVSPRRGATRIGIASPLPVEQMQDGDSVAVDGVCLTVAERRRDRFYADVVAETLARSTLGTLRSGHKVNLERSLRLGDRLGGHVVLGHVDGTVEVVALDRRGADCRLRVSLPPELARFVSLKGSVAVQGISLTVAGLEPGSFEIALVPHTLERTTVGQVRPGDRLNVEVDLLARYLERLIHNRDPDG